MFSFPAGLCICVRLLKIFDETVEIGLLKQIRQTLKFACKFMSMNQVAPKPAVVLKAVPGYCSTIYRGSKKSLEEIVK
jgi:hypothetical protein